MTDRLRVHDGTFHHFLTEEILLIKLSRVLIFKDGDKTNKEKRKRKQYCLGNLKEQQRRNILNPQQ